MDGCVLGGVSLIGGPGGVGCGGLQVGTGGGVGFGVLCMIGAAQGLEGFQGWFVAGFFVVRGHTFEEICGYVA